MEDASSATAYGSNTSFINGSSTTNEYTYNANGNLTKDLNKGITNITYNMLSLPSMVTFNDGSTISYTYAADGTKLRSVFTSGGTTTQTDYCSNVIYENNVLKRLLTDEGYVDLSSGIAYYYYLKDHQGNNRVVINSSGTVKETNHYYPFGGLFASSNNIQPYKYNGKEYDTRKGLNLYDYGARQYDPTIARWTTQDPMAEKYYPISLYTYCAGNPVNYIDTDGRDVVISGILSDEATKQLQSKMQNRITLSRDAESGRISYTLNEGQKLTGDAKRMASMIEDQSIIVNLITTNKNETSTGNLMIGGAFMGNTVTTDANGNVSVVAYQEVNPIVLSSADAHTNTMGKMMMHEVTEAYAGAQISQKTGVGASPATQTDIANPRSVYNRAHNKATSQTPVFQTLYDKSGNITTDVTQAVRVEWSVIKDNKSKTIQTYP